MSLLDVDAKSIIKRINRIIKTIEEKKYTFKTTGEILQILKDIDFAYNDNVYNFLEDTTDALSLIPKNYELSIEVNAKNKLKNDLNENEKFPSYKLTVSKGKFQKILNRTELNRGIALLGLYAINENLKNIK